jgi:hypothetical protein
MGRKEREKGARGEREACLYFEALGMSVKRVGNTESTKGGARGWDVEARAGRNEPWNVQVKNVQRCPSIPGMFEEGATLVYLHLTGEGSYVIVAAEDLPALAREVVHSMRREA